MTIYNLFVHIHVDTSCFFFSHSLAVHLSRQLVMFNHVIRNALLSKVLTLIVGIWVELGSSLGRDIVTPGRACLNQFNASARVIIIVLSLFWTHRFWVGLYQGHSIIIINGAQLTSSVLLANLLPLFLHFP